jgi:N-acetylglucosamine kinase
MILAFDIGGSRIRAALAKGGSLTPLGEVATPTEAFRDFVEALRGFLRPGVRGLALSIAGVVEASTGLITVANIPCLHGRPLARDLGAALDLPVLVLNDADCFALAEARAGAGRGHENIFAIILGTGVGGGLILNGRLVQGEGGFAGEWGHGPVLTDPALPCGCGQVGCLDTIGGARGMERLHLFRTGEAVTVEEILRRWRAGDGATVDLWLERVSGVLALVLNTLGASVVPVGGGLGNDHALVAALDATVRAKILRRTDAPLVVSAEVSTDAGLVGAAAAGEAEFG